TVTEGAAETRPAAFFLVPLLCGYGASLQNVGHGCHGGIDLGVGVVEVGREANSGFRTPVYKNVAGQKLAAHLLGIGHIDGDGAAALLGIAGSADAPSLPIGECDETRGLAFGFLADFLDTDFLDDFEAGTRRFDRRNVRGSVHETEGRVGVADGAGGEGKRIFVGKPSGKLRLQFPAEVGADVEVGNPRTAAQPFEHASAGEVGVERPDVDRDRAEGLKRVEHDVGSNFVRFVDDGFGVVDVGAAKNNVRNGHDQSVFVDGVEQTIGGNADAIISFDHVNLGAILALGFPEIHDGRKVQVAVNDFVALAGEVKTRSHHGLTGGDILVKRDGILGRVHQGAEFVANFRGEHPPAFLPGANAAGCPDIGIGMKGDVNGARHGSEGVGNHVVGTLQDRKLGAIAQKVIG